jgi:hypothetical protein
MPTERLNAPMRKYPVIGADTPRQLPVRHPRQTLDSV